MNAPAIAAAIAPIRIGRIVATLGVAQIIAWGTLYYAIAILGRPMAVEFGVAEASVFGAFTVSLVISGLIAPAAGRTKAC